MVEMQDELWMDYELILKIKLYTVCEKERESFLFFILLLNTIV